MTKAEHGVPQIRLAAPGRTPASIQELLKADVDVMARTEDGMTPLHYAAN